MSLAQFTDFIKKITTENDNPASDSSGTGAVLQKALGNLQGSPEQKIDTVSQKLSEVAKSQGFDVSEADVKQYIDSLRIQYEINPVIAAMADTYCSTSCHFGSLVSAS